MLKEPGPAPSPQLFQLRVKGVEGTLACTFRFPWSLAVSVKRAGEISDKRFSIDRLK
jgi:hypothetical protein